MNLESLGLLPYYKLEKTKEDEIFFFNHVGFYNFWDTYLILNSNVKNKVYHVIVNRTDKKFKGNQNITLKDKLESKSIYIKSLYRRCPKEMFNDFPELDNFRTKLNIKI